ncbi:sigma-70 family RNA polymerase sigma factor [Seongchinamella sediminis]|uniref:Sigma-70 family RNA polymerase sigma factor n=1 Tax=Seongchinamella sediminis TaxID=2283635 RepID=A0A3L7E1N2_9GAMM|nr:RNA polymerase sigma factor [Seongchinamella sediminis]RLQ22191.1 sigma-70 family RNA polymerase sigma factor [Seongchinamella sediminis]
MTSDKDKFIAELVARHGAPLENYLARKLDNREDAAELAQEAYMRLHRLEQPEKLDNARAFLFQVATNLAVDQLRRRQLHFRFLKTEKSQAVEGEPLDLNAAGASPEQILGAREKLQAIEKALEAMPLKVRQAFLLHRQNGLPYSAIAEQMQVSVSSVEKYILRALQQCRQIMAAIEASEDKDTTD